MRLSRRGVRFIASWEGWEPRPYNDAAGHATIGYGHLLHFGPVTPSDRKHWGSITKMRGRRLLRRDAETAERAVRQVKVKLSQRQFDALVSFAFNVGSGAFLSSTLYKRLNQGEYYAVPSELARWNKAGGVVVAGLSNRRRAEAELWRKG